MKFKIELTDNWRPDKRSFYTPGVYRVPEDLSEIMAELAVSQGGAKRLEKAATFRPGPAKRTYTRRAKGPAPENKVALGESIEYIQSRSGSKRPFAFRGSRKSLPE